jgi:hypothetical protein
MITRRSFASMSANDAVVLVRYQGVAFAGLIDVCGVVS